MLQPTHFLFVLLLHDSRLLLRISPAISVGARDVLRLLLKLNSFISLRYRLFRQPKFCFSPNLYHTLCDFIPLIAKR